MSVASDIQDAQVSFAAKLKAFAANPQPTYTVEGESVQWADYLRMITEGLKATNELLGIFDPFELRSVVR